MYHDQSDIYSTKTEDKTMTKREIFLKAAARREAHRELERTYAYHEGNDQDDYDEMQMADWTFTKANQAKVDSYNAYYNEGKMPKGMKNLSKAERKAALEKMMDEVIRAEFKRYCKAN